MEEKIFVAGHRGMVGSAIVRVLRAQGRNVVTVDRSILDLRRQTEVEFWFRANQPTAIIFAAAKLGGIFANSAYPADFIYDNLTIQTNVIHGAHKAGWIVSSFLAPPASIRNSRHSRSRSLH